MFCRSVRRCRLRFLHPVERQRGPPHLPVFRCPGWRPGFPDHLIIMDHNVPVNHPALPCALLPVCDPPISPLYRVTSNLTGRAPARKRTGCSRLLWTGANSTSRRSLRRSLQHILVRREYPASVATKTMTRTAVFVMRSLAGSPSPELQTITLPGSTAVRKWYSSQSCGSHTSHFGPLNATHVSGNLYRLVFPPPTSCTGNCDPCGLRTTHLYADTCSSGGDGEITFDLGSGPCSFGPMVLHTSGWRSYASGVCAGGSVSSACDASLSGCRECCAARGSCSAAMDCCSGARTLSVTGGGYCGQNTRRSLTFQITLFWLPVHCPLRRRRRRHPTPLRTRPPCRRRS